MYFGVLLFIALQVISMQHVDIIDNQKLIF